MAFSECLCGTNLLSGPTAPNFYGFLSVTVTLNLTSPAI